MTATSNLTKPPKIPSMPAAKQRALAAQTALIESQCYQLAIVDTDSYQSAGELLKRIKSHNDAITEVRDPILAAANFLLATIKSEFGALLNPLIAARDKIDKAMGAYRREREAARLAELGRERVKQEALTAQLKIDRASELLSTGNYNDAVKGEELLRSLAESNSDDDIGSGYYAPPAHRNLLPELKVPGVGKSRELPRYRIVDIALMNREYLMPDDVKIKNAIKLHGKHAESVVGGIAYYTEPSKSPVRG